MNATIGALLFYCTGTLLVVPVEQCGTGVRWRAEKMRQPPLRPLSGQPPTGGKSSSQRAGSNYARLTGNGRIFSNSIFCSTAISKPLNANLNANVNDVGVALMTLLRSVDAY